MTTVRGCWRAASANDQRYQEPSMGTWGTGPFDSDLAADFVDELERCSPEQIIEVLQKALQRVADSGTRVDSGDGVEAVASAALVAAQVPGSRIVIDPDDGPKEPPRAMSGPPWNSACRRVSGRLNPPVMSILDSFWTGSRWRDLALVNRALDCPAPSPRPGARSVRGVPRAGSARCRASGRRGNRGRAGCRVPRRPLPPRSRR